MRAFPLLPNSFRNAGIAVPVVQFYRPLTVEIAIKYLTVAVLLPPCAQLAIPHAVQPIDQSRELESHQRVEVLIAQVTLEGILLHHVLDRLLFDDLLVQSRLSDAI